MSHEWHRGGNLRPGELEVFSTRDSELTSDSPIDPITPGRDTSEFQFTRGAQVIGGGLLAFMIVAQFIFERSSTLPTSVMVTALIVAGLVATWPTVQYTLNRRRLKSDRLAAQQAAHAEALKASSTSHGGGGGGEPRMTRKPGFGTDAAPPPRHE